MAERHPSVDRLACRVGEKEEEKGAEAAPAWQPEEVEEVQLLQAGEWLSWAAGLVAAAGLAPSHPPWTSPGKEGTGLFPTAGLRPCSIHWALPAPSGGQRDGAQCPHQPLSQGWPCLGSSVGLGRVLQPLPQPLSSACAPSLPDADWDLPEDQQEQEQNRALVHSRAELPTAIPTWAGPALAAQLSTAIGALDVMCLFFLLFLLLLMFWESLKPSEREDATITTIELMADSDSYNAEACAAMLDVLVGSGASNLEHVPRIVRCIYWWLASNTDVSAEHRLDNILLELTHAHHHDVVATLLRCAPLCDRAAATMWRVMASTNRTAEVVLLELLRMLQDWPLHSTFTSDGDNTDIFALAGRLLGRLSSLPHHGISLPHAVGWNPGLGAGLGAARPGAPPASPMAQGTSHARALPWGCLGTERCLWVFCFLQATRALWEILRLPRCPESLNVHFPRLLLALLFQIFFSTEQMPEEVNTFWRKCQQEGCLPTSPNRFVVLTVKALLCRLEYEDAVFEFERKRGWDTLLNAETRHYAMGLLARELHGISRRLCYWITRYLVQLLSSKEPRWEVPAMAFLVELLACPDIRRQSDCILQFFPRYLWSECRVMHRLVLRGLIALCTTPSMAKRMRFLLQSLIKLLQDEDDEVVEMTLSVLRKVLLATDIPIASRVTLRLAERLRPLFDNDANNVRLLSIQLFQDVMQFVMDVGKQPLKTHVQQSLIPLLCHLHDENQRVAEASRKTLLEATKFLKKRELTELLEREQTWVVGECLVRTAPKPQTQAWTSHLPPVLTVWGWQLCPCPLLQPVAATLQHTHAPFPRACGPVGSSAGSSPSPSSPGGADGAPAQLSFGSRVAPQLPGEHPALCSLPTPAPAGWWLGVVGVLAGKASPGCRGRACTNPSFHPLALSPAGREQEHSRRVPAPDPAVPAEPTGAHARGGHQVHR
ncbi:hypothetical protein QYF61_026980 [Mycteria americana]|uniref:Uncharacterized protein n=1 Tax=Mycteria americana TaxID=33587 RepID=A0AAN7RUP7_MYCAM|nr:hypothetical protein QYF61_026980 [Mycteria americana]